MRNDDDGDWTVASSEEGGGPPSTFRYTITTTVTPSDHGDESQFETFDIEAYHGEEPGFASLCSSKHFPTVVADPFTVDRFINGTIGFNSIKQDFVCLCSLDDVKDVNMIFHTAITNKAVAFLTIKKPTQLASTELPVFVVSRDMMIKLTKFENVTVSFQRFLCGVERSASDDDTLNLAADDILCQDRLGDSPMDSAPSILESSLTRTEACDAGVPAVDSDTSEILINTSIPDTPQEELDLSPLAGCESNPIVVSGSGVADLRVSFSVRNASMCRLS